MQCRWSSASPFPRRHTLTDDAVVDVRDGNPERVTYATGCPGGSPHGRKLPAG